MLKPSLAAATGPQRWGRCATDSQPSGESEGDGGAFSAVEAEAPSAVFDARGSDNLRLQGSFLDSAIRANLRANTRGSLYVELVGPDVDPDSISADELVVDHLNVAGAAISTAIGVFA